MAVIGLKPGYPEEFRKRAIGLTLDQQAADGVSLRAATEAVADQMGCSGVIIRRWLKNAAASQDPAPTFTIQQLLTEFGVSSRTLRFYEEEGFVKPARRGPTRIYSEADRDALIQVVHLRRLGFSISEIQEAGFEVGSYEARLRSKKAEMIDQRRQIDECLAALDRSLLAI